MANTSHFHGICQFHLESIQNVQKYDIPQDYVSWHFIFPIKSAENRSHFVFCPGNSQNWKKKKKERRKNYHFHEIYGKRSQKSWQPQDLKLWPKKLPCTPYLQLYFSKTAHVNYYKILYLTFLKLFLQRNI